MKSGRLALVNADIAAEQTKYEEVAFNAVTSSVSSAYRAGKSILKTGTGI